MSATVVLVTVTSVLAVAVVVMIAVKSGRLIVIQSREDEKRLREIQRQVLKAASEGDEINLMKLVRDGASLRVRSKETGEEGLGPLHLASWAGHVNIINFLVSQNVTRERAAKGRRPVHWAAVGGHVEALKALQEGGCDVYALTDNGSSALHLAADFGNLKAVRWLVVEAMLIVNQRDGEGHTASYLAKRAGHRDIHRYLNWKITDAAADGDVDTLMHFLKEGCDINQQSTRKGEEGLSAVHLAAWGGHHLALKALISYGGHLEKEAKGRRPVHWAAMGGHVEALKALKEGGCNVHSLAADKSSALHLAADYGNTEAVQWLVEEAGLPLNLRNGEGHTASHLARIGKHYEIVKFLHKRNPMLQYKMHEVVDILGCGGFGEVYLVGKENKQHVLKVIERGLQEKGRATAEKELELLKNVTHPNIVAFKEGTKNSLAVFLLTEYCEGGDLRQRIVKSKREGTRIEEGNILQWCCHVTEALKYLHKQGIIHRDVKPNNIFLTRRNVAKLGDFGVAGVISYYELPFSRTGTVCYMSPEVSNKEPYDTRADMWSLGCCLYELAALKHGYPYTQVDVPSNYSESFSNLVKTLLRRNPQERPTADTLLRHPLLARTTEKIIVNG